MEATAERPLMPDRPRRVDLHPDQFIAGIAGSLDPAELGVFTMAVLIVYSKGRGFRNDAEAIELIGEKFGRKADPRTVKAIYERLVQREKIRRDGSEMMPNGCRDELDLAVRRIRSSRENGGKGGRPSVDLDTKLGKINGITEPPGLFTYNPGEKLARDAPSLPLSIPKESPPSPPPGDKPRRDRKSKLSEDWKPDERDAVYASSRGWSADQIAEQGRKFYDHHRSRGNAMVDWNAAWRTWVGNAPRYSGLQPKGPDDSGLGRGMFA